MNWMLFAAVVGMMVSVWMLWGGWAALFTFCVTILFVHHLGRQP